MSQWSRWSPYPKPAPKRSPPDRGIKVKRIGATWWGVRWIEALERIREHTTVLLVEQNLGVVRHVAEHVVVLDQGRVVHMGPAPEFLADRPLVHKLLGVA